MYASVTSMTDTTARLSLHDCLRRRDLEKLVTLLDTGKSPDERDERGRTPLHSGADQGWNEIVEILICYGANVNAKDIHGLTPLHKSAWHGHRQIVKVLIRNGAMVNVKDRDKQTPLHFSAARNHKKIVELLIKHGADLDPVDSNGDTPLMRAEKWGHTDVVMILRQAETRQSRGDRSGKINTGIFGYSSIEKHFSFQSLDDKGQITKVEYNNKEVTGQVTGIHNPWAEFGKERNLNKVKVNTHNDTQGRRMQEVATTSCEKSSNPTSSERDTCISSKLTSATSASPFTSVPLSVSARNAASSPPPSSPPSASPKPASSPSPPLASSPPSAAPTSTPPAQPVDEVTQLAKRLIKAVKDKRDSGGDGAGSCQDQDSLNCLSEQLNGSIIVINQEIVNNHTHYHNYNNTCGEVKVETSETVNVCVGGPLQVYQCPAEGDQQDDEADSAIHNDTERTDDQMTINVDYGDVEI